MRPIRRPVALLAAAACLSLVVGACGGKVAGPAPVSTGDGASMSGKASSVPASSSASANTAAQKPDPAKFPRMKEDTQEGANATLEYFFQTLIYAYQTGDTSAMKAVSGPHCDYCNKGIRQIEARQDGSVNWGRTATQFTAESSLDSRQLMGFSIIIGQHSERNEGETSEHLYPQEKLAGRARMIYGDGRWTVDAIAARVVKS